MRDRRREEADLGQLTAGERILHQAVLQLAGRVAQLEGLIAQLAETKQRAVLTSQQRTAARRAKMRAEGQRALANEPTLAKYLPLAREFWRR